MQIEINTNNSKKVTKLLSKFLEMNENGIYDYLEKDKIYIGYNSNSGFTYLYLENNPSLSLCLDMSYDLCIIYSSGLDGIEFIKYTIPKSLDKLDEVLNKAYNLEDDIRGDNYNNKDLTNKFIKVMLKNKWEEL